MTEQRRDLIRKAMSLGIIVPRYIKTDTIRRIIENKEYDTRKWSATYEDDSDIERG